MQQRASARETLCQLAERTDTEMRHIRAVATIAPAILFLAGPARADRATRENHALGVRLGDPEPPPPEPVPPPEEPPPSDGPGQPPTDAPPIATPIGPEKTPGIEPAPGAPTDPTTNETGKRIGVGVDALLVAPVSDFGDLTGPIAGPVLRFGYRVIPLLEIAIRGGYLFGTKKTTDGILTKVDILPLWLGARLFMWKPFVGPYVTLEGGMNSLLPTVDPAPTTVAAEKRTELRRRFGGNMGFGYLLSENLPIDLRAQVMLLNLIGQSADLEETINVGVSLGAGYTLQF
jgi:hypothetical protein